LRVGRNAPKKSFAKREKYAIVKADLADDLIGHVDLDMPTPFPPLRLISWLAASGIVSATTVFCLTPNRAAAAVSSGGPVLVVIKAVQKSGPAPVTTTSSGPALPTGQGAGGSTANAPATSGQSWMEITVSNVGDSAITGLTINYHVFSKTSTLSKTSTVTMTDASGTQVVDIPYGKNVVIKTPPILTLVSSGLPTGRRGGTTNTTTATAAKASTSKTTATKTSTVTNIVGSYIEAVTDNPNHPVSKAENPNGIVQQYESLLNQNNQ
jgi:hypothetical protein